jgi:hypothetical protein
MNIAITARNPGAVDTDRSWDYVDTGKKKKRWKSERENKENTSIPQTCGSRVSSALANKSSLLFSEAEILAKSTDIVSASTNYGLKFAHFLISMVILPGPNSADREKWFWTGTRSTH